MQMEKKRFVIFAVFLLVASIFLISFSSSEVGDVSYCCERLKTEDGSAGSWCQDAPQEECYTGADEDCVDGTCSAIPTSCESTSYCSLGTCINTLEGSCIRNTAEQTCNAEGGTWSPQPPEDLPQCQLGCCLLGNEAAFVTQTACSQLSSDYNLETNYRADIRTELECIASASSEEPGACVFERDFTRTCLMLTQKECNSLKASSSSSDIFEDYFGENDNLEGVDSSTVEFHQGFLCSATELATVCGPRGGTTCVEGEDEVYFKDTCGNLANVYDSSKLNNNNYWTHIQEPTCGSGKNSPSCGDCGYFEGSTCKSYDRGEDDVRPDYGENVCRSLDCGFYDANGNGRQDENENYQHGERFCITNNAEDQKQENLPGTRYATVECRNGEFITESCSEFRSEICVQGEIEPGFNNARCVVNRWQDCTNQTSRSDCLNNEIRDCEWQEGNSLPGENGKPYATDSEGNPGFCVPKYTPGFDFYANEGNGDVACSVGTSTCSVVYELGILRSKDKIEDSDWDERKKFCVKDCHCIPGYEKGDAKRKYEKQDNPFDSYEEWVESAENICTALGDCGNKQNYLGISGEETEVFESQFIRDPNK